MPRRHETLTLALDPGTRETGVALLEDDDLLDYRVMTFRNGHRPHDLLGLAKAIMVKLLAETRPDVVVLERPFFGGTRRSALLTFIVQELRQNVDTRRVRLREYGPRQVRELLLKDPHATKRDIARHVAKRYPELGQHLHFGHEWREKYWSHVFDAVAVALADRVVRARRK